MHSCVGKRPNLALAKAKGKLVQVWEWIMPVHARPQVYRHVMRPWTAVWKIRWQLAWPPVIVT